jgi:hypothetical protein
MSGDIPPLPYLHSWCGQRQTHVLTLINNSRFRNECEILLKNNTTFIASTWLAASAGYRLQERKKGASGAG